MGEIIELDGDMCALLNSHFLSVFTQEKLDNMPAVEAIYNGTPTDRLDNCVINDRDVLAKLEKLKVNKSPGPDEIYARVLKECREVISGPLAAAFNESIESGSVPEDWKVANVVPIFKKGSKTEATNYRPISLTSLVGKLLESIIRDKITEHLDKHSLIRDTQHGFRSGRSCLTNLLSFFSEVFEAVDRDKEYDIIYLDFSKAFDKVPYNRLLHKVAAHGIGGNIINWLRGWLVNRSQRVCINGSNEWGTTRLKC